MQMEARPTGAEDWDDSVMLKAFYNAIQSYRFQKHEKFHENLLKNNKNLVKFDNCVPSYNPFKSNGINGHFKDNDDNKDDYSMDIIVQEELGRKTLYHLWTYGHIYVHKYHIVLKIEIIYI
jgi:hypothetical protein